MLTVLTGIRHWPGMTALGSLLAHREHERARAAYRAQLLWQISAQLHTMAGGGEYSVPDYFEMFPPRQAAGGEQAGGIRRRLLTMLRGEREADE